MVIAKTISNNEKPACFFIRSPRDKGNPLELPASLNKTSASPAQGDRNPFDVRGLVNDGDRGFGFREDVLKVIHYLEGVGLGKGFFIYNAGTP